MDNLTTEEKSRYHRHLILPEIGEEGQQKLKKASVLVIGAGGLGCPVLQYLCAAGVGIIGVIDDDKVDESNLQRQVLYNFEDVGGLKAKLAAEKLQKQNPFVNFHVYTERITSKNALEIIKSYDIVVDGTDNFASRYLINDACVILKKTLVFGAIFKFEGQVSVFNYKGGPTYRCLFPEPPGIGESPGCSEVGVIGVLPGIVGTLQVNEVIKIITGVGKVLSGRLCMFNALAMEFSFYRFDLLEENLKITTLDDEYEEVCRTPFAEIEPLELKKLLDGNQVVDLIDVRSQEEFEICNLGGRLFSLQDIQQLAQCIDPNNKTVIYCHRGSRSRIAIEQLMKDYTFKNLYNLKGGIDAWALQVDKSLPRY